MSACACVSVWPPSPSAPCRSSPTWLRSPALLSFLSVSSSLAFMAVISPSVRPSSCGPQSTTPCLGVHLWSHPARSAGMSGMCDVSFVLWHRMGHQARNQWCIMGFVTGFPGSRFCCWLALSAATGSVNRLRSLCPPTPPNHKIARLLGTASCYTHAQTHSTVPCDWPSRCLAGSRW